MQVAHTTRLNTADHRSCLVRGERPQALRMFAPARCGMIRCVLCQYVPRVAAPATLPPTGVAHRGPPQPPALGPGGARRGAPSAGRGRCIDG